MPDIYRVVCISSSNISETCFVQFNQNTLITRINAPKKSDQCLRILFGENFSQTCYVSFDAQPNSELHDDSIGIGAVFAQRIGLKTNDLSIVESCSARSLQAVYVIPKKKDDYDILVECKNLLELNILNQVRIVMVQQVLPIQIFGNVKIDLCIEKLKPNMHFGRLEQYTELILDESKSNSIETAIKSDEMSMENSASKENPMSQLVNSFRSLFSGNGKSSTVNNTDENPLVKFRRNSFSQQIELRVIPDSALVDVPNAAKRRMLFTNCKLSRIQYAGPCSLKMLCRITTIEQQTSLKNKSVSDEEKKSSEEKFYCFIASFNNTEGNELFCSSSFMRKLKLELGSRVLVEPVRWDHDMEIETNIPGSLSEKEKTDYSFWSSINCIKQSLVQIVTDNIAVKQHMNSLIVGNIGTGKSSLLTSVRKELIDKFIYVAKLECKPFRRKKVDVLRKLFLQKLSECSYHQPSVLILDDLDALLDIQESEFNDLYKNWIGSCLLEYVETFQRDNCVYLIASTKKLSNLGCLSNTRGPRLFENVLEISDLKQEDRHFVLRLLTSCKGPKIEADNEMLNEIAEKTHSYNVQDLVDLFDKALLRNLTRCEGNGELTRDDFNSALSDTVPISLRGVELHKNISVKWEDIGGLEKAKETLMEVFAWPSQYPKIFETCPIRHQTGVLLYGAPGTGKTLIAGAIAGECGLNFISIKGPELLSKYVGASEEGVRNLFIRAQKAQPCVLFFDEFDSLAPRRGHDSTGVTDRVVNQLLTQLDGVEALSGVWILAATSRPDLIDPALLRPGRLDRVIHCPLPDQNGRLSILTTLSRRLNLASDVDLVKMAETTEGYTGADLQSILYTAQVASIKEIRTETLESIKCEDLQVTQQHLLTALTETKQSITPLQRLNYYHLYETFISSRGSNFKNNDSEKKITFA